MGVLLVVYLLLLAAGLWWLLHRILSDLAEERPLAAPQPVTQRQLALWALACTAVVVPIGAALGPAWPALRDLFF